MPQFFIESNSPTLNRGDDLRIECTADLYVYSNILIRKDGVNLQQQNPKEVNETSRVITIQKQAALEDSATYTCVGTLRRGGENTKNLTLAVKGRTFLRNLLLKGFCHKKKICEYHIWYSHPERTKNGQTL